jgi:1,4-dihydroxy-2-naphthoate octaprenyltransferase
LAAGFGVLLLHLSANVFNDYFDVKSGTDAANTKYFVQYSGGSRAIEMRLIDLAGTRNVALVFMLLALGIGLVLTYLVGTGVLVFGLAGLTLGFFYTAPPIRLVARHGLGELAIGMAFGPLITMGMAYVATGQYLWEAFFVGIPAGLLTTNILMINQIPDAEGDAVTGKNHLVVTFGPQAAAWFYTIIWLAALAMISWLAVQYNKPLMHIATLVGLLYGFTTISWMFKHLTLRSLVKANVNTINLQILVTVLMAVLMAF